MKNTFTNLLFLKRPPLTRRNIKALIMRISQVYFLIMTSTMIAVASPRGNGQSIETTTVELEIINEPLKNVFQKIEAQTDFLFHWNGKVNNYTNVMLPKGSYTVKHALDIVLQGTELKYEQSQKYILVTAIREKEVVSENNPDKEIAQPESTSAALVTGTVKSAITHEPIAGVNIIVKGTTKGTTTDVAGKFAIEVEANDILVFSFIGFKPFEAAVGGISTIDVTMEADVTALQEVEVNAGYWIVKERANTGNISKVSAQEIAKQPVMNPLEALHGRMTGVHIQQVTGVPGSPINIQIRGRNSLRLSANEPLFIIDGVPFSFENLSSSTNTAGILGSGASPLNSLNPGDIESIEVLKDADATAIYGSRGANGVVLITTKKGRAGKTQVDLKVNSGAGKIARRMDLLDPQQYFEMRHEAYINDGITTPPVNAYDINGAWDQSRYTDWQKVLVGGTMKITDAELSVSGGNETTNFLINGGYKKQGTVYPGHFDYRKISSRLSVNHVSVDSKLTANASIGYVVDKNNQPYLDLTNHISLPPNAPDLYNEDGTLNWANSTWTNPLSELEKVYDATTSNLIGNFVFGYKVLSHLQVKTNIGVNSMQTEEISSVLSTNFNPALGRTSTGYSASWFNSGRVQSWILEPQIRWNGKIVSGEFEMLVGTTFQGLTRNQISSYGLGFPDNSLIKNIKAASTVTILADNNSDYRYNGFFGRINYNWLGRYIFNFTGRRDGSSRFGPGKQFANFGAIGFAWVFTNEKFFKSIVSTINHGKLRFSYGSTGNDQIGDYQFMDTYSTSNQYQGVSGLKPTRLHNSDFAWEVNTKLEAGFETAFFDDRLSLSVSYYRNRSSNQLVNYTLPLTTGFTGILTNLNAIVQNTGFEGEVSTNLLIKNGFRLKSSINITIPRNKLIEFPGLLGSSYESQYSVGEPLSIIKRYHYVGLDPYTGTYQFDDMNGDGQLTAADRLQVVRLQQDFYGGFSSSVSFKNLELSLFFQYVKQAGQLNLGGRPGGMSNVLTQVLDRWQNEGDASRFQRFTTGVNSEINTSYTRFSQSDASYGDASFIRLKNISLSYHVLDKLVPNIKSRIYVQGQNLFTITNYEGMDPEGTAGRLPPIKLIVVGLQISL